MPACAASRSSAGRIGGGRYTRSGTRHTHDESPYTSALASRGAAATTGVPLVPIPRNGMSCRGGKTIHL